MNKEQLSDYLSYQINISRYKEIKDWIYNGEIINKDDNFIYIRYNDNDSCRVSKKELIIFKKINDEIEKIDENYKKERENIFKKYFIERKTSD